MPYGRTPSNHTVHQVDFSRFNEKALECVNQNLLDTEPYTNCKPIDRFGFVDTAEGIFMICGEGVGSTHAVSTEHPFILDFHAERKEGDNITHMRMGPACNMKLDADTIRECATGETEPLHTFIRVFGSRLDNNYVNWERHFNNNIKAGA